MPKNCCKYFTVSLVPTAALILAILFAGGIIILPVLYEELTTRVKYGVILDAGSTHTNLFVYEWDVPKDSRKFTTGKIKEVPSREEPVKCNGSLSSYASDPTRAGEAISLCLQESYEHMPRSERNHTEVYLGATAGMRLVRENNQTASDEIMKAVRKTLKASDYAFKEEQKQAQIIPGGVEAASGWTTANYAMRNFRSSKDHTIGALDLGGASAEVAFETSSTIRSEYQATEKLFGKPYDIYARSYLCFGAVEAERRYLAYLLNQTSNTTVVADPCQLKGAVTVYNLSYLHQQPCIKGLAALEAFGHEILLPSSLGENQNISFNGTGEPDQCKITLSAVFNFYQCVINGTCIGDHYYFPPVAGEFVGFSAFYYAAKFFREDNKWFTKGALHGDFGGKVANFCNLSLAKAHGMYPNEHRLKERCFSGSYVLHLLEHGFGFNASSPHDWRLKFVGTVHDISIGWALGYLLNITSTIPVEPYALFLPYSSVDLVVGILVLSILCLVFVVFFILTFQACRKVIRTRSGYTDIA